MNRFWIIGAVVVLGAAGVVGWLTAGNEARLDMVLVLADVTTAGCDGVGQVHLKIGNASGRVLTTVEGVLSIMASTSETPTPIGNFVVREPIVAGQTAEACVSFDEPRLDGRARSSLIWLARATIVEFAE